MKTIETVDGRVAISSILGVGINERKNVFAIELLCTDGVHIFANYPTLEKAERYFRDLLIKINHTQRQETNILLA